MKRLLPLALLLLPNAAIAQVMVTEVLPNPTIVGDTSEWIEIHNTGAAQVDISGWQLIEYAGGGTYAFPPGTILAANQVVIVTNNAADFTVEAMTNAYPITVADYELALATDDAGVPNMVEITAANWGLANSGGGVILEDATGLDQSWAEWGNGRAEVPGNPSGNPGAGSSIGRVADTGSSDVDFVVLTTPTPGTGFAGNVPTPPIITNPTRAPSTVAFGDTFTFSATVTDADGVAGAEVYFATATASITGNADAAYAATAAALTAGDNYEVSGVINTLVTFTEPVGFHERYVRYFSFALDNMAEGAELPAGAVTTADNAAYYWENVLPQTAVFGIDEARAQDASEVPLWRGHSVRVEGVALTGAQAFQTGNTNFFIAAPTGVDAIRVFDFEDLGLNLMPGDLVRVEGRIGVFRGVRQIGEDQRAGQPNVVGPQITVQVIGNQAVPMQTLDVATLLANAEANESQLVALTGVQLVNNPNNGNPPPVTWEGDSTLYVDDGSGTIAVRIAGNIDLADQPNPLGMFDLRGILTQFAPGGTGGYQLQPRGTIDVMGGMPRPDAGMMDGGMVDMGMMGNDTGLPPDDTGVPPNDTGVPPNDTGVPPNDTGVAGDGGVRVDTGSARDSGLFGQRPRDDGCGCTVPERRDRGGVPLSLLLLGLALVVRRRR